MHSNVAVHIPSGLIITGWAHGPTYGVNISPPLSPGSKSKIEKQNVSLDIFVSDTSITS